MTLPPTSIHHFFAAQRAPIPPDTSMVSLAIQIMHLHEPIGRWTLHGCLSNHPLTLYTDLLSTPFVQDLEFNVYDIPEEIRLIYPTFLYLCGRRKVQQRNDLHRYLIDLIDEGLCEASIILNTDDLYVLLYYKDTSDFLLINVISGMMYHETTVEGCMNNLPDRVVRIVSVTVNNNPNNSVLFLYGSTLRSV